MMPGSHLTSWFMGSICTHHFLGMTMQVVPTDFRFRRLFTGLVLFVLAEEFFPTESETGH